MSHAKATILCIDDHWKGLIARKLLLENSGYEVLEAMGVDEGMKLFRSRNVDAVLLDDQMRGMDGGRVAKKMKRIHSHVPILLLSAYGSRIRNKPRSVDSFLAKSEPPNILLSKLQNLLEGKHKPFFLRWLDQWRDQNRSNS
jgi:CheY-like chemotaxis protein